MGIFEQTEEEARKQKEAADALKYNLPQYNNSPTVGQAPTSSQNPLGTLSAGYNLYNLGDSVLGGSPAAAEALPSASFGGFSVPSAVSGNEMAALPLEEGSMLGSLAPFAVAGIGAYTAGKSVDAYNKAKGKGAWGGFKEGLKSAGPLAAVPVLGQAPALAGLISGAFHTGKDKNQLERDQTRSVLENAGFTKDYQMKLNKTGYNLDLGKDGGFKYTNEAGQDRNAYDIDWSDPLAEQSVGWLQPLMHVVAEGDDNKAAWLTGQIFNEIKKNGATDINQVRDAVLDIYHNLNMKPSLMINAVSHLNVPQEKKDAFIAAIESLRPGGKVQVQPGAKKPEITTASATPPPVKTETKGNTLASKPRDNLSVQALGVPKTESKKPSRISFLRAG